MIFENAGLSFSRRISIASGFLVLMRKEDLNALHVVDHFRKSPFY